MYTWEIFRENRELKKRLQHEEEQREKEKEIREAVAKASKEAYAKGRADALNEQERK